VTIARIASHMIHDDLTCVAKGCTVPQPATTDEVVMPRRVATLRTRATMLRAQADELDVEAERLDSEHAKLKPGMWLCEAHHRQINRHDETGRLRLSWLGGRAAYNAALAKETRDFLAEHPVPTSPGSELPTPRKVRRLASA